VAVSVLRDATLLLPRSDAYSDDDWDADAPARSLFGQVIVRARPVYYEESRAVECECLSEDREERLFSLNVPQVCISFYSKSYSMIWSKRIYVLMRHLESRDARHHLLTSTHKQWLCALHVIV
jgi:hypothetical protein